MALSVPEVRAIAIILSLLATFAVAARFWVRKLKKVRYEADDWTILASLILTLGLTSTILRGTVIGIYGGYYPPTKALDGSMEEMMKFHFTLWLVTIASVGMIKLSVLLLYRRLFFAERAFYIYSSCLCVLIALWALGFFLARIFMCGEQVSLFWNGFAVYKNKCKVFPISNGFGISDIITDGLVVLSPIPIVARLHMPKLQRAGILGIFALGFLSTAAGVARGYIVISANREIKKNPIHPVVLGTKVAVWSIIEITVAVIAACLVTLRPLVTGEYAAGITRSVKSAISLLRIRSSSSSVSKDDSLEFGQGQGVKFYQLSDRANHLEERTDSHVQV